MQKQIDAIFFDVGATLRIVVKDDAFANAAELELMKLVQTTDSRELFFEKLNRNWKAYRKHAKSSLLDISEMELWMQWLLPEYPPELIAPNAGRLTRLWRDHDGRRVPREGVVATIQELHRRGYKLGIIANTITETEIPDWMVTDGVAQYFHSVLLSSKVRLRKPDPAIYLLASRCIGVEPGRCAYVGDNPRRDVDGTFAAGYGLMIRIEDLDNPSKEAPSEGHRPDHIIHTIPAMLDYFPDKTVGV